MIKVYCFTRLDVERCEIWPSELPAVPNVGDYIQSDYIWMVQGLPVQLDLKVATITWEKGTNVWVPQIELGLPPNFKSMALFDLWYEKTRGVISVEYYQQRAKELYQALHYGESDV